MERYKKMRVVIEDREFDITGGNSHICVDFGDDQGKRVFCVIFEKGTGNVSRIEEMGSVGEELLMLAEVAVPVEEESEA